MIQEKAAILGRRQLSPGVYKYLLSCPGIARTAAAGQFVQVTAPGFFLRRPISICRIDPQAGTLVLVMEVRGNGTAAIAQLGSEDSLDLIGPLGSGFALKDSSAKALMVGGGIGLPPLCQPAFHHGKNAVVVSGFRNQKAVILADEIENTGAKFEFSTDDGSAGHHGLVTDLVKKYLAEENIERAWNVRFRWKSVWPAAWAPVWAAPVPCMTKRANNITVMSAKTAPYSLQKRWCGKWQIWQ